MKNKPAHPTQEVREMLAKRIKTRRKYLGKSITDFLKSTGASWVLYRTWEKRIPLKYYPELERAFTDWLEVPNGWLRNLNIVVEEADTSVNLCHSAKTISGEIRAISSWLSTKNLGQRTVNHEQLTEKDFRWASIFAERFGVLGEEASTLQSVGDRYGLTRERVRQITEKMLERASAIPVKTPLMDTFVKEIEKSLPAKVNELNHIYRDFLGENLSVYTLDQFCRQILGKRFLEFSDSPAGMVVAWDLVAYTPNENMAKDLRAIRESIKRMITSCGVAQISWVVGETSASLGMPLSREEVLKKAKLIGEFEWIHEDAGWFWLGENYQNRNKLLSIVRKIMSVSQEAVDVSLIGHALLNSRREHYGEDNPRRLLHIEPSVLVITEVLKKISWLDFKQSDDFYSKVTLNPKEILSDIEWKVYDFLSQNGGIASRYSLTEAINQHGDHTPALAFMLNESPIITKVGRGVYMLIGWPLDMVALNKAISSVGGITEPTYDVDEDGFIIFKYELSEYRNRVRIFDVSNSVSRLLKLGAYTMQGFDEPVILTRYENGSCRLNQFVTKLKKLGMKVGDIFLTKMHPVLMKIEVVKLA
ncbi:sigma factor-like helix-turn-helix DNA-binding protein [Methylophilus sp. Leaf414]|uniref:sigma factor-like helix-turn-helix DNA-binding protein n=1 Tax=Methylophilus sp. Leaf414 TaxID=1736371 RepID=UPI002100D806|nr:sigma factor-like helix-turn-helix DNA-binding protein [Methylophilus sp. Leaf414]